MVTPHPGPAVTPPGTSTGPVIGRPVALLLGAAAVVIAGAGIRAMSELIAPIMLALVLTIAVIPVAGWTRRRGWPNWLGVALAVIITYAIVLVLVVGVALAVVKLVDVLPQYADNAAELRADGTNFLTRLGIGADPATTVIAQIDPARLTSFFTSLLSEALETVGNLFFLGTMLFALCSALPLLDARADSMSQTKPELWRSLTRFVARTQRYLVITAVFGAIVAILDAGALWLLGVPLPLLWGLFSFITNFIPNIGFVIGVIPPALLALLSEGWGSAITVIVVYSGLNIVVQTFIQPRYVGATVGLSVEMTFLSLAVWTFLLGPLGALLAIPMTLLARALLLEPDARARWMLPLIATTPRAAED